MWFAQSTHTDIRAQCTVLAMQDFDEVNVDEEEVMKELERLLVDEEWEKRIQQKAMQKATAMQMEHREELREKLLAEKERQKNWNNTRDKRVDSWKNFKGGKKSKKVKKQSMKGQGKRKKKSKRGGL